jgi:putative oxidoreductase
VLVSDQFDLAVLVVRVVVGVTVFLHGANKVRSAQAARGTAGWFASMGMRPGPLNAWMAALTEMGAGVLFALGLLTPLAAAALVALMTVAAVVSHRKNGFFIFRPGEGWEYVMVLGVVAWAVGTAGAGRFSLDHALDIAWAGWWGAVVAAAVGLGGAALQLAVFYRPPKGAS